MIILASASPRRRELLKQVVSEFAVIPAAGEEAVSGPLSPEELACSLAEKKCGEVFAAHPADTVIGCDTIVVCDGLVLGKPEDEDDAFKTLKMLSGKTHYVITGVCMRRGDKKLVDCCKTEVLFNELSDEFIRGYIAGGSPMDKAGSYGIQDEGVVKKYYGSYTNVVGMPVQLVKQMLGVILK